MPNELIHNLLVAGNEKDGYRGYCHAHDCGSDARWSYESDVYREFACDSGKRLLFIVLHRSTIWMGDLTSLARRLREHAMESHYETGDGNGIRVWEWLGDGVVRELTVSQAKPAVFDKSGYAYPIWDVTNREDTVTYLTVSVAVHSRP